MAPVSSLLLSVVLPLFVQNAAAAYQLDTNIAGSSFFSNWNFQTSRDLSNGFVTYLSQSAAQSAGLLFAQDGSRARVSVDAKSVLTPGGAGRKSVRIQSKKSWTHGLFIHDIMAMPAPACGIWPALWLLGPNWPTNGEIDIVEGVNYQSKNLMTLHTNGGCTMAKQSQLGTLNGGQCDGSQNGNTGCGVTGSSTATYGSGFNANGGGVYATEWTKDYIKIWEFARNKIPSDITSGKPVPAGWGTPQAFFKGGSNCPIDSHFKSMSLVLNIDFCGDWAGNVWSTDATCKSKAADCKTYVAKTPGAFAGTQFLINSIKVYKNPSALKRDDALSAFELGPADVFRQIEERDAELASAPAPVTLAPEVLEREAAIDAYMRGEEELFVRLLERDALMEAMAEGTKIVEEVVEEREIGVRHGHAHSHAHKHLHRSSMVGI